MMKEYISLVLATISGIATLLGSLIVFLVKNKNKDTVIVISLSFSFAIMFLISIFDLIPEALNYLGISLNKITSISVNIIFILLGIVLSILLDKLLPEEDNSLKKIGILSLLTIVIHNIPEGIATFITSYNNLNLGIKITLAIALHNIPEGICICLPIYYSYGMKKALVLSFLAGLAEPIGAFLTFIFLKDYISTNIIGILFSIIAGIMIYISLFKLLKQCLSYKKRILTIISFVFSSILFILTSIIF